MKNVQHDVLLEQAIYIRAARTLCRDGWSCDQINNVLKNAEISNQQFEKIQAQLKELYELQKAFGLPTDAFYRSYADRYHSELDFLNRGPDAAVSVLQDKGWLPYEVELAIRQSMFVPLEEPILDLQQNNNNRSAYRRPPTPTFTDTQRVSDDGFSQPPRNISISRFNNRTLSRRAGRVSVRREVFVLTFIAPLVLVLMLTLLFKT